MKMKVVVLSSGRGADGWCACWVHSNGISRPFFVIPATYQPSVWKSVESRVRGHPGNESLADLSYISRVVFSCITDDFSYIEVRNKRTWHLRTLMDVVHTILLIIFRKSKYKIIVHRVAFSYIRDDFSYIEVRNKRTWHLRTLMDVVHTVLQMIVS